MNYKQFVISKNPTAYWTFDSNNESTAYGLPSTVVARTYTPTYPYTKKAMGARSKFLNSANFTDLFNNSYIDLADAANNRAHVEAWIYIPTTNPVNWNDNAFIFRFSSSLGYANQTWMVVGFDRRLRGFSRDFDGTPTNDLYGTTVIPFDTWTHVAWQQNFTGSTYTKNIYVNGILDATVTTTDTIRAPRYCWTTDRAPQPFYSDEIAVWAGDTVTLPTQAEILQRASFPMTKTKWWDPATSSFITSADELYWNGSAWESMQDKTYQYWNGTSWVTL
jgi:hypothetical protein